VKQIIISFLISLTLLLGLPLAAHAANPAVGQIQCGVNAAASEPDCSSSPGSGSELNSLLKKIINIISLLVGALAVIMLIVGGFRYVTSAGNDSGVAAAKKTITYALVGIVIVAISQTVVHFVLNNVTTTAPTPDQSTCQPGRGC
jgi:hypothetical protein